MNQSTNPATVGLFLYIQIVYDMSIDYVVFDTLLNGLQCLGVAICLAFSISSAIYKHFQAQEAPKKKVQESFWSIIFESSNYALLRKNEKLNVLVIDFNLVTIDL